MKFLLSIIAISFLLSGCSINSSPDKKQKIIYNDTSKEEEFCTKNKGKIGIINECGKDVKICTLEDGTDCPLGQFFRGDCEEGLIVEWGEQCRGKY